MLKIISNTKTRRSLIEETSTDCCDYVIEKKGLIDEWDSGFIDGSKQVVDMFFKANGYFITDDLNSADIIVFFRDGDAIHTGLVLENGLVESKYGQDTVYIKTVEDVSSDYQADTHTFYKH